MGVTPVDPTRGNKMETKDLYKYKNKPENAEETKEIKDKKNPESKKPEVIFDPTGRRDLIARTPPNQRAHAIATFPTRENEREMPGAKRKREDLT